MRAQLRPSIGSSKWRKCVISLLEKDSNNMPWVDCTLKNLSENSFELKETQAKLLAETLQIPRMQIWH